MNPDAETLAINLRRQPGQPWGFRLQGGADFSTPLSVQSVNPGSVSEQCGLHPGDAVLSINGRPSDEIEHEVAKSYIVQSGDNVQLQIMRGAVKVWKPKVTPLSQLRPEEMQHVGSDGGEQYIQRTSLAADKQEPLRIGSSHNRAPKPFGGFGGGSSYASPSAPAPAPAPAPAQPAVVHSQFNSPMPMYSQDNAQQVYSQKADQLPSQMSSLSVSDPTPKKTSPPNSSPRASPRSRSPALLTPGTGNSSILRGVSPTAQLLQEEEEKKRRNKELADNLISERFKDHPEGTEIRYKGYTDPNKQSRSFQMLNAHLNGGEGAPGAPSAGGAAPSGFRSVRAPTASSAPPPQQQQQHSTCTICGTLIIGVFVRIKGEPMHAECFKCASCGLNLKQQGYFKVEGKLYCEQHARQVAKPPAPDMVIDKVVYN